MNHGHYLHVVNENRKRQRARLRALIAAIACWTLLSGTLPFLFWLYTNARG